MDAATRITWVKPAALTALTFNSVFLLTMLREKNKQMREAIDLTREAFEKLDEGFFIMTVMSDVLKPTEEQEAQIAERIDLYKWEKSLPAAMRVAVKTSPLMRSHPQQQGDTMSETTPPAETPQVVAQEPPTEKKPSRVRTFINTHPRAKRAAQLTAAGLALVVGTRAVTNAQHNKAKLAEAADHAEETLRDMADAVTMPDES